MRRDPELREYKLVFLTDRTQLDGQLTETFMKRTKRNSAPRRISEIVAKLYPRTCQML